MAFVNDEVVEVGLGPVGGPALCDGPSAGTVHDRHVARAVLSAGDDQDVEALSPVPHADPAIS